MLCSVPTRLAQPYTFKPVAALGHKLKAFSYSGMYHEQLQRYLELFDRNQLLVVLYDDFRADRQRSI